MEMMWTVGFLAAGGLWQTIQRGLLALPDLPRQEESLLRAGTASQLCAPSQAG